MLPTSHIPSVRRSTLEAALMLGIDLVFAVAIVGVLGFSLLVFLTPTG